MIVHLECLVGKVVRDANGRAAGRLEEVHGEQQGSEFVITHYVLTTGGYLAFLLRQLGIHRGERRVSWEELDLTNPEYPRLHPSR